MPGRNAYLDGLLVNEEPNTQAARFAVLHGPCAASMGFRVVDAAHAYKRALSRTSRPGAGLAVLEVPTSKDISGEARPTRETFC
jgi:4-hydroxyphenylpyruvate dioxygenase